jgi:hypothetical protein
MNINQLTAGDTLSFTTSLPDYPATAGWSMVYKIIPRTAGSVIELTSVASGDDHLVQAGSSVTATWAPGVYSWAGYATNGTERYTLQTGNITIAADPGAVTTLDNRSSARKALEAVNTALESYGAKAYMQKYELNGRMQQFHTPGEFLAFRSRLATEVAREDNAARIAAGLSPRNQIAVRFTAR